MIINADAVYETYEGGINCLDCYYPDYRFLILIIMMGLIIMLIGYFNFSKSKCEHEYKPNYCTKCGEKKE